MNTNLNSNEIIEVFTAPGGAIDVLANFAVIVFGLAAAYYIFTSAANAKALRMVGYDKAWLAWVPYLRYWAIAEATKNEGHTTKIYGRWNVPNTLYTLWFTLLLVVQIIDSGLTIWFPASLGMIIDSIIMGVLLGGAYAKLLSKITHKTEPQCYTFGICSGVFPIIAAFKFCFVKPSKKEIPVAGLDVVDLDKENM